MPVFSEYAKTDEFKRAVREAVDEIVRSDLIAPLEARVAELEKRVTDQQERDARAAASDREVESDREPSFG